MIWSGAMLETLSLVGVAAFSLPFIAAIERGGEARFGGRRSLGALGFRQSIADFLKLFAKEDFVPNHSSRRLYTLAPILAFGFAFCGLAFLPLVPAVRDEHGVTKSVVIESDYGLFWLLMLFAAGCASSALGGWASNNKLSLLGGVRALSRLVAVQVVFVLAMATLAMSAASARLDLIASSQNQPFLALLPQWNIFTQPLGAVVCFLSGLALCAASPFDLVEGRGKENLLDPRAEYGALKFAFFIVADRIRLFTFAVFFAAGYLGGHAWPWSHLHEYDGSAARSFLDAMAQGILLFAKTVLVLWAANRLRWAWPRLRPVDLTSFAWRWLLPAAILNFLWVAALIAGGVLR